MKKSRLKNALFTLTLVLMLAPLSHASLTDGLVAYYPFNCNADDYSGYNNDGTVYGATWTGGKFGGALSLDGIDDYVRVPDSDSLDVSDAITIAAWIMSDSTAGPRVIVSKWDDNTGEHSYIFKDHNVDSTLRIELSESSHHDLVDLAGTSPIIPGNWIHVAATFDSTTAKLYYSCVEDSSTAAIGTIKNSAADLLIGAVFTGGTTLENFDGLIDEVYIYNRALSDSEIEALAGGTIALIPAPGAILLGSIGICFVGWARRRRVF